MNDAQGRYKTAVYDIRAFRHTIVVHKEIPPGVLYGININEFNLITGEKPTQ